MFRKLGQHFLQNRSAVKRIISALELARQDTVIEIGPGKGALTFPLVESCKKIGCRIIAIEKDLGLGNQLKHHTRNGFNGLAHLEVINGDALKLIDSLTRGLINWKLTGNIPYYITGRLFRILSESEHKPELAVLTIQREVAERLSAKPPKMNLLAAVTQFWSKPKIITWLEAKDFSPPPKVRSAIIKLTAKSHESGSLDREYYKFVRSLFKQPRKTIINNLRGGFKLKTGEIQIILEKYKLSHSERPQNLPLETLIKLSVVFSKLRTGS